MLNKIENKCDMIICCGDIIGIGPYPEETVQRLMQVKNLIAVKGNHEKYLCDGLPDKFPNKEQMDKEEKEHHIWEHKQLSKDSVAFLSGLPYKQKLTIDGTRISVMHYAIDNKNEYMPYSDNIENLFSSVDSDVIIYGHNHTKSIYGSSKKYINVGALGCPGKDKNTARYGILEIENGNVQIADKECTYDVQKVIDKINELNYPAANEIKMFFYGKKGGKHYD